MSKNQDSKMTIVEILVTIQTIEERNQNPNKTKLNKYPIQKKKQLQQKKN